MFEDIVIKNVKPRMSDTEIIILSSLSPESSHSLILLVSVDKIFNSMNREWQWKMFLRWLDNIN